MNERNERESGQGAANNTRHVWGEALNHTAWRVAVIGAGPVGLALALHGARLLPEAAFTVFDARPAERDVSGDPRTLALSLGSVRFLQRLGVWAGDRAAPIHSVHISQAPPSPGRPAVLIDAAEVGEPQLGAVLSYGALVAPLQAAWLAAVAAEPSRLAMHFGAPVRALAPVAGDVQIEVQLEVQRDEPLADECNGTAPNAAGDAPCSRYDLVVVAEGGVFADQARKGIVHDYQQTAWVGTVVLQGGVPGRAYERFTRQGPVALLPLPPSLPSEQMPQAPQTSNTGAPAPAQAPAVDSSAAASSIGREHRRAALVWCVQSADDPVRALAPAQCLVLLQTLLPAEAGQLLALSPLKEFALGLNAERTLVAGRTVRIGNAAQTLHPVAGQGLNLGLRDAHELVSALRHTDDLERALKRVEWSRAPDRWGMIVATDFLARSFTWPGLAGLRAAALGALEAMPAAKAAMARGMMFGQR